MSKGLNAALTAAVVLFAPRNGELHVLLIERGSDPHNGCLALPGGYVDEDEDTVVAACRELEEETGIRVSYLRKVGWYDKPGRDPRGRVVSVAYSAVLLHEAPEPVAADDAAAARWVRVEEVQCADLAFDHGWILQHALDQIGWTTIRDASITASAV